MSGVSLNTVQIDYVTLTGIDRLEIVEAYKDFITNEVGLDGVTHVTPERWMQFQGERKYTSEGSIWTGSGVIQNRDYLAIRISGELATNWQLYFNELVKLNHLSVKRIDIQTTVLANGWEQLRFHNRMRREGKRVETAMSVDQPTGKTLETVAVGSRRSQRYTRVYEKITDDGTKLLRCELELKGELAHKTAVGFSEFTPSAVLKHHIESKIADQQLTAVYANVLAGIKPHNVKLKVMKRDKKKSWLLNTILPSFEEYINRHDNDGEVVGAFLAVLEEFCYHTD